MTSTPQESVTAPRAEDSRVAWFEIAAVLAITLAGLILRVAFPSHAAIEHFDEGVYATRLWFADEQDAPYPDRHLYAPPLVPWMVRWSIDLFGPGLWGAMLPAVVFGTLTIPLVWWTARRWFGGAAGLAGAVLAAGSDFHVLYSRTALTDVPLCFWLLASVYCAWESFRAGSFRWAILAGMAAGLAWWTKYNGWLAVAIAGAGVVPWLLSCWTGMRRKPEGRSSTPSDGAGRATDSVAPGRAQKPSGQPAVRADRADGVELRPTEPRAWRVAGCWIVLAAVACVVWSPVVVGLQEHGGYGVVAANHQTYVVGLNGWWESFRQQVANHWYLDSVLTWTAVAGACAAPLAWRAAARRGLTASGCVGTLSVAGLALAFAAARSSSAVIAVLAVGGLLDQVLPGRSREIPTGVDRDRRLAAWLLAAWFAGLLVATPLYRAFPRLTLPWLVAAWLGAGAAIQWAATGRWWDRAATVRSRQFRACAAVLLFLVVGVPAAVGSWERASDTRVVGWQDRSALRLASDEMAKQARRVVEEGGGDPGSSVPFVVYVYAEPAIVFHLTEMGYVAQPVTNLAFIHKAAARPDIPTFFVAGPHAWRTPGFERQSQEHRSRFELYCDARYTPSALVLLNLHTALELMSEDSRQWPDANIKTRSWKFTLPYEPQLNSLRFPPRDGDVWSPESPLMEAVRLYLVR